MLKRYGAFVLTLFAVTGCSASPEEMQTNLDRTVFSVKANNSHWEFLADGVSDPKSALFCAQTVAYAPKAGWTPKANDCAARLSDLEHAAIETLSVADSFKESSNDEFISDLRMAISPVAKSSFTKNCEPSVANELLTKGKSACVASTIQISDSVVPMMNFRNKWGSFYNQ